MSNLTWERRITRALKEFPGGARVGVICEELNVGTQTERNRVSTECGRLAAMGRLDRHGERGQYVYSLPGQMPDAHAYRPADHLPASHPTIKAAREIAQIIRPDLAEQINHLADWATGESERE